jgi:hypothetical protein
VSGLRIERIACLEHLFTIGKLHRQLALHDVAPVRALAAIIGQALEQARRVDVLAELGKIAT